MAYRILANAVKFVAKVAGGTAGKTYVRVGNRAVVSSTKIMFKSHRDLALRKIGLEYDKLYPAGKKFIDETHEVIARAVIGFTIDIAQAEWDGLTNDERAREYKAHLFSACRKAVFSRVNSNLFDIGFDLGANGNQLRLHYASQKDPEIKFMNDFEWLKVITMSFMESLVQEMDAQHA